MPRVACWSCGRTLYTTVPLESLFAEERRCPRCGALLNAERREDERRQAIRRTNAAQEPGPPGDERRVQQRRQRQRRQLGDGATRTSDPRWME
jgi:ribosomal protein S27AE